MKHTILTSKLKSAMRFIAEGNKVKATIMFRGRELSHPEMGKELLLKVAEAMQEAVTVEREPKLEGKKYDYDFST